MEPALALIFLIALAVSLLWLGKCVFVGIIKAFMRCWWLALLALVIAPALLLAWAIYEVLCSNDEPINTHNRRE